MPKTYYVVVFIMLIVIIFLLIYIAADVAEIRNKTRAFDAYIDANHQRFIKICDDTRRTYDEVKVLSELKDSLDAKKNFIEGLEHGKDTKSGTRKTDEHA